MENRFLQLESALNMILNVNVGKETRLQELTKIEDYAKGLSNLPKKNMQMLMAAVEVFREELEREETNEECIAGYNKIIKERLNITRSLRSRKCVIFGNNWLAEELERKMRTQNYCVFNWQAVNPAYLNNYDLYILCDDPLKAYDLSAIHDKDKLIKIWDYLKYKFVLFPSFYKTYANFLRQRDGKVKCIITGNTNIVHAVHENLLHIKAVSLANNAQDLFYDFKMFCHAYESMPDLEYAVIGLVPYALRYDASKSKVEWRRSLAYYPVVETMHNCEDREHLSALFESEDQKIKAFLDEEYMQSLYGLFERQTDAEADDAETVYDQETTSQEGEALNIREISELYNRPYTDIVLENKVILEEYARFCKMKHIQAVFFIPPYTIWYKEHMKKSYYEELRNTAETLCAKYDALLVDMMDVVLPDCCFRDYANMNYVGAVKAASYINEILEK